MNSQPISNLGKMEFPPFEGPITEEEMAIPVILHCGHSFEEKSITVWLKTGEDTTCPTCRKPACISDLAPNFALRDAINAFPDFVKKQIALAVKAQTEKIENSYKRKTDGEIIVDWRRIEGLIHNEEGLSYPSPHSSDRLLSSRGVLLSNNLEMYRHLILHEIIEDYSRENKRFFHNWTTLFFLINSFLPKELAQRDGLGRTPLHLAAQYNQQMIIRELLKRMHPEDLGITDIAGRTPLQHGLCGHEVNIELMIPILGKMTSNSLENKDENGRTFMHYSSIFANGMSAFTPFLNKATPEILCTVDDQGHTPIHTIIGVDIVRDRNQMFKALHEKLRPEDLNKICEINNSYGMYILLKFMREKAENEKSPDEPSKTERFKIGDIVFHNIPPYRPDLATVIDTVHDLLKGEYTYRIRLLNDKAKELLVRGDDLEKA